LHLQWSKFLFADVIANDSYVIINLDETSIQHEYASRKGFLVDMSVQQRNAAACFFQPLKMSSTRSHMTLVASICNNRECQPYIPQFLIPNKNITTQTEYNLMHNLRSPIMTIPDATGWVTKDLMPFIITSLRRGVHQWRHDATMILVMDAASQHLSHDVLCHAARLGVMLVSIPAGCTWLLQPLDVSVFRCFKDTLRQLQMTRKIDAQAQQLNHADRINILGETIQSVLVTRNWQSAFDRVGLCLEWTALGTKVYHYAGALDTIPNAPLTQDDLVHLIGRERATWHERFIQPSTVHIARRDHAAAVLRDAAVEIGDDDTSSGWAIAYPSAPPPMPPPAHAPDDETARPSEGGSVSQAALPRTRSGRLYRM
jgi:hypothetical protein